MKKITYRQLIDSLPGKEGLEQQLIDHVLKKNQKKNILRVAGSLGGLAAIFLLLFLSRAVPGAVLFERVTRTHVSKGALRIPVTARHITGSEGSDVSTAGMQASLAYDPSFANLLRKSEFIVFGEILSSGERVLDPDIFPGSAIPFLFDVKEVLKGDLSIGELQVFCPEGYYTQSYPVLENPMKEGEALLFLTLDSKGDIQTFMGCYGIYYYFSKTDKLYNPYYPGEAQVIIFSERDNWNMEKNAEEKINERMNRLFALHTDVEKMSVAVELFEELGEVTFRWTLIPSEEYSFSLDPLDEETHVLEHSLEIEIYPLEPPPDELVTGATLRLEVVEKADILMVYEWYVTNYWGSWGLGK